jgi:PAS domain S-box-containing protein
MSSSVPSQMQSSPRLLRASAFAGLSLATIGVAWPGVLPRLLSSEGLLAHGHSYRWEPGLVWLHVTSDAIIGLAYAAISCTILIFLRRGRALVPFSWIFVAFGAFIVACGMTHVMEVWTLWTPQYWLSGSVKLATAVVSLITAIALPPLVPRALALLEAASRSEALAEERARTAETNARLASIIESSNDAIVAYTLAGVVTSWNRGAETLYGYRAREMVGQPLRSIVPADRRGELVRVAERVRQREEITRFETERRCKDGRTVDVSLTISPILGDGGEVVGVSAIARDITARKVAEAALRRAHEELEQRVAARTSELSQANQALQSEVHERERIEAILRAQEARHRAMLEAAIDAIITIDGTGRIVEFNPTAESIFGFTGDDALGARVDELIIPPELWEAHRGELARYAETGESAMLGRQLEMTALRVDGTPVPIEVAVVPTPIDGDTLFTAFIRDITERRRAEERLHDMADQLARSNTELRQSNRELEEFAYAASHDLKEPLRMVASFTQLLQRRYATQLDAEANEFIEYAVDGATRMQQLIDDLLAYSRVGRGGMTLVPTSANRAVRAALRTLERSVTESNATIRVDPMPEVLGDEGLLTQLFQNLIGNAIKFRGSAPPLVHCGATQQGERWEFFVRDNGIGFDAAQAERVFQIFTRLHTREEFQGSGVGLAVCKKIVEVHGGTIHAESVVGTGSVFRFTLLGAPHTASCDERGPLDAST